ncbi:hypothetical protein KIN20_017634 [Parelaphostrongylus tenuis]|uniref:Uncharacterized protein n=1 Tax=Parelaphostrongylus tenuis TaxID=148309 RepID=A0AAD5QNR9_PARTN|nr:hypothetical protein KIN20_017634 [Parelaphostrongylus tenuis]
MARTQAGYRRFKALQTLTHEKPSGTNYRYTTWYYMDSSHVTCQSVMFISHGKPARPFDYSKISSTASCSKQKSFAALPGAREEDKVLESLDDRRIYLQIP